METAWLNISAVLAVFTLAIVSPGPNFLLVVETALGGSRRTGLYTALGVATGSGLFAAAGLFGLLLLVTALPHFATILALGGGSYLVWLGACMLWQHRKPAVKEGIGPRTDRTALAAYRKGLLTNLTNPKAWAFYLSLFTLVMAPGAPTWEKSLLGLAMFSISLGWYGLVALLISDRRLQPAFFRYQPIIQVLLGGLLIALGGRLIFSALPA